MKIKFTEYHQVFYHKYYDIPDEEIISEFGSLEAFEELDEGEQYEFFCDYDYDTEEDWWTMRKGGYDTAIEVWRDDD